MENEFPPNSHSQRDRSSVRTVEKSPEEKPEVRRVITGKVKERKKPLYRKFFEAFRPEDNVSFVEYTLLEVLVPSLKDSFRDTVDAGLDNVLGSGGTRRRRNGGGYSSYSSMSSARPRSRRDRDDRDDDRRPAKKASRGSFEHREFIIDSKVEGEEILDNLIALMSQYDAATVRDLLSLLGEPHNPVDLDWGWTDLRGARIHRLGRGEGYLLDLPRPVYLD